MSATCRSYGARRAFESKAINMSSLRDENDLYSLRVLSDEGFKVFESCASNERGLAKVDHEDRRR